KIGKVPDSLILRLSGRSGAIRRRGDLAHHLGMRDQCEEYSAADDVSEQDRCGKRYQHMAQPELSVGDQQKGFDAAGDNVLEATDADQVSHHSNYVKGGGL